MVQSLLALYMSPSPPHLTAVTAWLWLDMDSTQRRVVASQICGLSVGYVWVKCGIRMGRCVGHGHHAAPRGGLRDLCVMCGLCVGYRGLP